MSMIRLPLVAAMLLAAAPLVAQQAEAPPAPAAAPEAAQPEKTVPEKAAPEKQWKTERVKLQTAEGPIVLELEVERAPATSANFLKYVDQKKFDGITFYRALTFPGRADLGLIQGGQRDQKKLLPAIAHEPTSKTGLSNRDGAIAMARGAPGSAQADFFIIMGDLSTLDASPKDPGFAVFGRVVEGMDVVKKIVAAPVSATEGVGAMKGQMIAKPVPITTARRVPK